MSYSPRMNHIYIVLESDPYDIVLSEISGDRCHPFTDLISFIGLKRMGSETRNIIKEQVHLLSMSGHPVLIRIDCNGVHGKFVGSSKDTDSDFLIHDPKFNNKDDA